MHKQEELVALISELGSRIEILEQQNQYLINKAAEASVNLELAKLHVVVERGVKDTVGFALDGLLKQRISMERRVEELEHILGVEKKHEVTIGRAD